LRHGGGGHARNDQHGRQSWWGVLFGDRMQTK
jgi:hypothetical protein